MLRSLERTRQLGILEGASFLLLLGVAMPLKYVLGMPLAVRIVGSAHGVLFIAYLLMATWLMLQGGIGRGLAMKMVVASLVPGGPFVVDRELRAIARQVGVDEAAASA